MSAFVVMLLMCIGAVLVVGHMSARERRFRDFRRAAVSKTRSTRRFRA